MSETLMYGQIKSESLAKDSKIAREIIREIGLFGINDRQRWLLVYNLALEIENIEEMKALTTFIRDLKGNDLFITKIFGVDEEKHQDG